MLWDPTKEKKFETKADPFTLDALIAWLEKQPEDRSYCYLAHGQCLMAAYLRSLGYKNPLVGGFGWRADSLPEQGMPHGWDDIAAIEPHTFGAALKRARALRAAANSSVK